MQRLPCKGMLVFVFERVDRFSGGPSDEMSPPALSKSGSTEVCTAVLSTNINSSLVTSWN